MKTLLLFFILLLTIGPVDAQNQRFKIRFGITGTGTSDEGLWYFRESQGLGPQVFKFQNSWGLGIDLNYQLTERLMAGIHFAISRTGFQLAVDDGISVEITEDNTSHNQLIAEAMYTTMYDKVFRPFIGLNAGILFTRDIQLTIGSEDQAFEFINPFIYGLVMGFDLAIGSNGWSMHFIIRGQTFEYTTRETALTYRQTLLDQVWWMNYNHLQFGIGKSF